MRRGVPQQPEGRGAQLPTLLHPCSSPGILTASRDGLTSASYGVSAKGSFLAPEIKTFPPLELPKLPARGSTA